MSGTARLSTSPRLPSNNAIHLSVRVALAQAEFTAVPWTSRPNWLANGVKRCRGTGCVRSRVDAPLEAGAGGTNCSSLSITATAFCIEGWPPTPQSAWASSLPHAHPLTLGLPSRSETSPRGILASRLRLPHVPGSRAKGFIWFFAIKADLRPHGAPTQANASQYQGADSGTVTWLLSERRLYGVDGSRLVRRVAFAATFSVPNACSFIRWSALPAVSSVCSQHSALLSVSSFLRSALLTSYGVPLDV